MMQSCFLISDVNVLPSYCKENVYAYIWKVLYFLTSLSQVIDLVAILPFYVELAGGNERVNVNYIKILRLTRGVRIFKIVKNNHTILWAVLYEGAMTSAEVLMIMGLGSFVFACMIFAFEGGELDETDGLYYRNDLYFDGQEISPFRVIYFCFNQQAFVAS